MGAKIHAQKRQAGIGLTQRVQTRFGVRTEDADAEGERTAKAQRAARSRAKLAAKLPVVGRKSGSWQRREVAELRCNPARRK